MAPEIIGLTGKQEAGKSTAARHLRERHGYAGTNLTDPFDEMLVPLMRRMKVPEHEILPRLNGGMKNVPIPGFEWLTGRKLKQAIGLEFRDAISRPVGDGGTDRGFFHDLWRTENAHHPRLVHEQVRYGFEADLIRRDGGKVYRVFDPDDRSDDQHESERIDFPVDGDIANPKIGLDGLHAALDAIVGEDADADVRHEADHAPLAAFDDAIAAALNEHGDEIREIADRMDGGDDALADAIDGVLNAIGERLREEAAASASAVDADHVDGAVGRWVADNIGNSAADRRVAAVYAHLGAAGARHRLGASTRAVYKATITVTVMGVADDAAAFEGELDGMSLTDIMQDADGGCLISGGHSISRVEHVHRDDVADELRAIGNDGMFFEYELEDGSDDAEEDEASRGD